MKKKISLLLAITMLLSGCNTAEKAAQTTSESTIATISEITTTTTAETTVATTTTKVTTTTVTTTAAEKQTSAPTKETEITQATEDTPMTPKSEVYLFDYHSFDEIAPSEEEQFEIFENVFYGEWESDLGDISFTYQDCYFDFANSCDPTCLMEIDEGYVLPYIAGGVVCCFFVNKNDLSVMYNAEYDFIIGGITIRENAEGLHKSSRSYSKEISEGELSSLGQMKLNSIIGGNFEECLNGTLDEKPIFTDIDGTEWIYGLGTYATPDEERRYLVSYSEDKVELGIRHFKKSEYDAYMDRELDGEPEEQYFVLVFEKQNGEWRLAADSQIRKLTPVYNGINGEVLYVEDADTSQEPFAAYYFTYVHTGGEAFRLNEGEKYRDYTIGYARHVFNIYEDEFVEWGNIYAFDESVTLNGKLEIFTYLSHDEPELFLTITVDDNPGFPFPYSLYWDEAYEEIIINLGKPEDYADNAVVMDFIDNHDTYLDKQFSVTVSNLIISLIYSGPGGQSDGKIEKLIKI